MIPIFIKLGLLTKRITKNLLNNPQPQSQASYPDDGSSYCYQYGPYINAYPQSNFYDGTIGVDTTSPPFTGIYGGGSSAYGAFGSN